MKTNSQLNVRIHQDVRDSHRLVAGYLQISIDELTEASVRYFYGSKDPKVLEIRRSAMEAVDRIAKGIILPFGNPWISAPESA